MAGVTNYTDDKFPMLVDFYEKMRRDGFGFSDRELRFLRTKLTKPDYDPEKDLFVLEDEQGIRAVLDIIAERRIGRIVLNCMVRPGYSYESSADALMASAMIRCTELNGDLIHVCLDEKNDRVHHYFRTAGFSRIRTFLELEINLTDNTAPRSKSGIMKASFSQEDVHSLTDLQNRIFTGSWGFCPNTDEDTHYYLALTGIGIEDIILLKEGSYVVGYCWAHESLSSLDTLKIARIHMIGIDNEYQGKGLGTKLLNLGFDEIRSLGFRRVELTVDSENRPACGLYAASGFRLKSKSVWFEKKL